MVYDLQMNLRGFEMNDAVFRDTVTVTLPPGLHAELTAVARSHGVAAGEFIRRALKSAVTEAISPDSDSDSLSN